MIVNVFAILDSKVGSYSQPFFAPTVPAAIRNVQTAVSDPSTMLSKYPGDFGLWHLGAWDDQTGLFEGGKPYFVCAVSECVSQPRSAGGSDV